MRPSQHTAKALRIFTVASVIGSALVIAACSGGARGTRPNDMSYEEHQAAAEHNEEIADFNEALSTSRLSVPVGAEREYVTYGSIADNHRSHAQAHREAAVTLAEQELAVCIEAPEEARVTCPLSGPDEVLAVDEIANGVRIVLATTESNRVRSSSECHLGHAAFAGFEGMDGCIFYLEGIAVDVFDTDEGTTELLVTSTDSEVVEQIRGLTM